MKRSQLALAITGLLASSTSYADINYVAGGDLAKAPSVWAKELAASQSSVLLLQSISIVPGTGAIAPPAAANAGASTSVLKAGHPLNVTMPVGFKIPGGSTYYIRVELDNGAKFSSKEDPACVSQSTVGTCSISSGGKGASYVTFSLGSPATSVGIAPADAVTLNLTGSTVTIGTQMGIIVSDTSKDVSLSYSLHTNGDSAGTGTLRDTAKLSSASKTIPYIKFTTAASIKFSYSTPSILTSEVSADFLTFASSTGVASLERAELGQIEYGPVTGTAVGTSNINPVMLNAGTGSSHLDSTAVTAAATNLGYLISGTGTTLDISGGSAGGFIFLQDVSGTPVAPAGTYSGAANRIFILNGTGANCSVAPATAGLATNATTVTADKAIIPLATQGTFKVCVVANKASIIPSNDYIPTFNPGATSTSKPSPVVGSGTATFRKIVQNGTVLDTPFVTLFPGYISRVIFSNTGNVPVKYSAIVVTDDGATATLGTAGTGVIPAGKLYEVNTSNLVTLSGKPRGAVRFTLGGSNQTLGGIFQVIKTSPTIGDVQSIPLIRKGGNADPTN